MNYEVLLRPEAEADITEAYRWYEKQDEGLGEEFLRSVDACFAAVQRTPTAYPGAHRNVRRALLRKFPYGIFYLIEADRLIVLACFHARRDPKQWQERL